ncbi:MAG: FAD-dependent oxidoreductase, partial [Ilumatobacteraceae bacterium]
VERRSQLTFVVAGGGFAGTEMVAELSDFAYSALRHYPRIPIGEFRFVLIHSRDRILPEIGAELAAYALDNLRSRGIEVILGSRVHRVDAESVVLGDHTVIGTRTVVWTAGNRPNPLVVDLPCGTNDAGALIVDSTLLVAGYENVWALGDCAEVPDPDGGSCPPTAQHATRQGTTVAKNIIAVESGREPEPFVFSSLGTLVALGHRTAVAEIRGRRFSGLLAWFMWRSIYLFKLPTLEKQARVVIDWTADLLFARDIVLTSDRADHEPPGRLDVVDHEASSTDDAVTHGNVRMDPDDNDSTEPNPNDGVAGDARPAQTGGG